MHRFSNYDYLATQVEGELECLGENKEKYKTFSIPIKMEITKIDKDVTKVLQLYLEK